MLIGTSLGRCLHSILSKEVELDEVVLIIARTRAPDAESLERVVREYWEIGNPTARSSSDYNLGEFPWEDVIDLAHRLWQEGRIHQPRNFDNWNGGLLHPDMGKTLWLVIAPTNTSSNPGVVAAWEQYLMLSTLAE
jgi:hypothetical protein